MSVIAVFTVTANGDIVQTNEAGVTRTLREVHLNKTQDGAAVIKTVEARREISEESLKTAGFGVETVEVETTIVRPGAQIPAAPPEEVPVTVDPKAAGDIAGIVPGVPFQPQA